MEDKALYTASTSLDHHNQDYQIEEALLVREEDEQVHSRAIDQEPDQQHHKVDKAVGSPNSRVFELVCTPWTPAHVVVVTDEVYLNEVEERIVLHKVSEEATHELQRRTHDLPRLDEDEGNRGHGQRNNRDDSHWKLGDPVHVLDLVGECEVEDEKHPSQTE